MTVKAVVGAQWGDEGKGKIVDLLAQQADIVVRFQGGANAGHTVVNSLGKFALHLIPCGIFNPNTLNIIGTGTVVDLDELIKEIDMLEDKGINTANLRISNRAHISLPIYSQIERLAETERGERKQGSTLRGISPAYAAKALRVGLQMGSLHNLTKFKISLTEVLEGGNRIIAKVFGAEPLNVDEIVERYLEHARRLTPYVCDSLGLMYQGLNAGKNILLEGQLGTMRDLDWGIYPYVTSSNPLPGGAAAGAGIPAHKITSVLGVVKAFSTSVGEGPFATEQDNEVGKFLREVGLEFGATTGRPRRCGWLDAVGLKYAAMLNGFTEIAITKLDTLDGLESLKVCVGYKLDGEEIDYMPLTDDLYRVEPVYIDMPGWKQKSADARTWDQLPREAQEYVKLIESYCGAPATLISVGPEREATFSR